jgi:eukaryotic-like serine/threonine-protein kinase
LTVESDSLGPDPALRAKLTQEWDVRGIDVATLHMSRGTIVPQTRGAHVTLQGGVHPTELPELITAPATGPGDIELGETIGEGGMGIVWMGTQRPLRREVAVKSVRDDAPAGATEALLREARVTGALEHPNVVPIHAVGRDESGRPLIVMKLIEGRSWAERLERQRDNGGQAAVMGELETHIRTLVDVARAAHFAHSRAIIHRDLKPDNVMIGSFGEVYVVDWGIAVTIEKDSDTDITHAHDVQEVTGSPAYMAPEMAIGDGVHLDERTDVYLLGATLHEILTGFAPHDAPTTARMLTKAYASLPHSYDATIPEALAQICQTAMARDPEERFQTAAAFATALERFLEFRSSTLLSEEAGAKLETLREMVSLPGNDGDHHAHYHLFNECRFGFLNALRIWENNERAVSDLQDAIELMIEFELAHGSAGAAEALLSDLPRPRPRLAARISRKREREHSTIMELDELKRDLDVTGGDRPRAMLSFVLALLWPAAHALLWYVDRHTSYGIGHVELAASYGLFSAGSMITAIAARETLLARARFGLQTQLVLTLVYVALSLLWVVALTLQLDIDVTFALAFFVGAVVWFMAAIAVDRRLLAWAFSMIGALIASLVAPASGLVWMAIAGGVGSTVMGVLRLRSRSPNDALPLSARWSRREADAALATTRRDSSLQDGVGGTR